MARPWLSLATLLTLLHVIIIYPAAVLSFMAVLPTQHQWRLQHTDTLLSGKKKQKRYQPAISPKKKPKLRTAGEVLSKLKWSGDAADDDTMVGYLDRADGPMEMHVADFAGSETPEHRIQYFRRAQTNQIVWDRSSRVDLIFNSGNGADGVVAPETLEQATQAIENVRRVERGKEQAAALKKKGRAKRAQQRAIKMDAMSTRSGSSMKDRLVWESASWFRYNTSSGAWEKPPTTINQTMLPFGEPERKLVVVTWNVLFDLFDDEDKGDSPNAPARWQALADILANSTADIIALQEVIPQCVEILLAQDWVRKEYTCGPSEEYVDPFGNMLLWRSSLLTPYAVDAALSVCLDGPRKRVMVAALQNMHDSTVVILANVHLTADAWDNSRRLSRNIVRQRELSAAVGKMQLLEQQIHKEGTARALVTMIVGDFNSIDRDLVGASFRDAGVLATGEALNTFDPERNALAAKSNTRGPRAIDRLHLKYLGHNGNFLQPASASLLGHVPGERGVVTPSDHFGLCVTFDANVNAGDRQSAGGESACNVWASNAPPSLDTLLALVLEEHESKSLKMFDASSSLPIPHLTLLNGFVELNCDESRKLALEGVQNALRQTEAASAPTTLRLTDSSISLLQHRSSATLAFVPHESWVRDLYDSLLSTFCLCRSQEDRFEDGWTPHVSIESHGSTSTARENVKIVRSLWGKQGSIEVHSLGIFQRDASDGLFHLLSAVPLRTSPQDVLLCDVTDFLRDAGSAWFSHVRGYCTPMLWEIGRACQVVADLQSGGLLHSAIHLYGSHALGASLPGNMSDIDAIIELTPLDTASQNKAALASIRSDRFLRDVASHLLGYHPTVSARIHLAGAGSVALQVLTITFASTGPAIDLMLCVKDSNGVTLNNNSAVAGGGVQDVGAIREAIHAATEFSSLAEPEDVFAVYQGALRILKLWAIRRKVYGSSFGYLGGGGWAVFLARILIDTLQRGQALFLRTEEPVAHAARELVAVFFEAASRWPTCHDNLVITLSPDGDQELDPKLVDLVVRRGTMAVVAPASGGDLGRSTTQSTVHSTFEELTRAAAIVRSSPRNRFRGLEEGMEPFRLHDELTTPSVVLEIDVYLGESSSVSAEQQAELQALTSSFVLRQLVKLEREISGTAKVRPVKPVVVERGSYRYSIGIANALIELDEFASRSQTSLDDYLIEHFDAHGAIGSVTLTRVSRF